MVRAIKKKIRCGNLYIGGGAPISIQSMIKVSTKDVPAALAQIRALESAGCDIVRLTVPDFEATEAFGRIKRQLGENKIPLVADVHFDYRLAIAAMINGADKIRINPGNIGSKEHIKSIVEVAKEKGIPIRVGVNSGSLEKDILEKYNGVTAEGLAESALRNIELLEKLKFEDIVVSIKSSDVRINFDAHKILDAKTKYPFHIGITEAGTIERGIIKSAAGIGALLLSGIGDTIRVSLTGDPIKEVLCAKEILEAVGMRDSGINIISCPTCGRAKTDIEKIAAELYEKLNPVRKEREAAGKKRMSVAVMGCVVNGPGEAKGADFGVACGDGKGAIFVRGEVVATVPEGQIADELIRRIESDEADH